mmetsp:Transcript_4069/g.7605  ORF Transcript_4069/g.7605 Transcript_4069/m.7605 type:complete len:421 (+) Transcript_4069:43-1305(+)
MFFGGMPFDDMGGGGMPGGMPGMGRGGGGEPANTTELYEILAVDKKATSTQIKKAYFALARVEHPDKGGDAEKFKKIQAAYEVLKDEEKRAKYDRGGLEALEGGDMPEGADDIFSALFGGRRRGGGGGRAPPGPKKGPDVKHPLKVSLEDLYNGKTAKLAVSRDKIVGKPEQCRECNGRGVIVRMRQIGPGMVQQIQQQCATCGATGFSMKKEKERKVLEVNIERGMKNDEKIRFRGMSDEVPNAEPGDILFVLQEKEHSVFTRKHNDLLIRKEVTLQEALCGYSFLVTHLDGRKLLVTSKPGEVLRPDSGQGEPFVKCVHDEGMPKQGSPFEKGKLFIYFRIAFPPPGSLGEAELAQLRKVLPGPEPLPPHDPEAVETHTTEAVNLREFGKKDASGGGAYDSDDEQGQGGPGGVQCQQG